MGRNEKAPVVGATRALETNAVNDQENNVMSNISTEANNVIPFRFEAKEVRTLLVNDQPWFVAADVAAALEYREAEKMTRWLDEDEKAPHIVGTHGGDQRMTLINESGLYSAVLRSRKAEAKRFKKWVTAEVLPAIRKHGRYEDKHSKMATLMDELIGMSELSVIKGLIRDKGKAVQADKRQSFTHTMHSRLHTRFNVPRTELIPAHQFESACNFIAAYALEGEYLGKEEAKAKQPLSIHYPVEVLARHKPEMVKSRGDGHAWLDVSLHDLRDIRGDNTPCEAILIELRRAGYEVDGAWWELRTYRNKMQEIASFARGLTCVIDEPHRYAIKVGDAA
ncbi:MULTISPECIES: BRO-N domain-containing protein [unclassified Pseudomonas]|uniref:BRO-N domain-containing protein n=1 Tax=unclassified Pseudomonas TaxID=196821 RepID=UPI002114859D|nr:MULTISPECIES: Bro-N domain-containing protein [unclassified Pseudomonas]